MDQSPKPVKKLTAKEKRFCEEYMIDLNASRAARAAGYSERSCAEIGYENLRKPHISDFIDQRLKEKTLKSDEVMKLTTDLAKSSLNDFFTIKQVEHTPRIIKPLSEIIAEVEEEIKFEDEYAAQADLDLKERKGHESAQKWRKRTIIKYNIELKINPAATRIVNGPTIFVDHAELNMVKLVKAKEAGRIKSISHTQFGIKVEMYAADAALVSLARMHGLYIDNIRHSGSIKLGKELADEDYED